VFLITDGYSNGGDPVPAADTVSSCSFENNPFPKSYFVLVERYGSNNFHFWNPEW